MFDKQLDMTKTQFSVYCYFIWSNIPVDHELLVYCPKRFATTNQHFRI